MTTHNRNRNLTNRLDRVTRSDKIRKPAVINNYRVSKNECQPEVLINDTHYTDPRTYNLDSATDNEFKASDDRTSNESIYDAGGNPDTNDGEQNYREYTGDLKQREKIMQDVTYSSYPSHKRTPNYTAENYENLTRSPNPRRTQDYDKRAYETMNDPQASALAAQKLKKFKELQRRKEYVDRFYSQDPRRTNIPDPYIDGKTIGLNSSFAGRQLDKTLAYNYYPSERIRPNIPENFDFCGTMTTTTKLTCGCVEQTTRPIFTTSTGRTQRRSCPQDQQVHLKISSPNSRLMNQHHLPGSRLKSKSFNERGLTISRAQDYEKITRKHSETTIYSA